MEEERTCPLLQIETCSRLSLALVAIGKQLVSQQESSKLQLDKKTRIILLSLRSPPPSPLPIYSNKPKKKKIEPHIFEENPSFCLFSFAFSSLFFYTSVRAMGNIEGFLFCSRCAGNGSR